MPIDLSNIKHIKEITKPKKTPKLTLKKIFKFNLIQNKRYY